MKNVLWGLSLALMLFTANSNAEIYKWKDKNGVVRYSDVPPPSNIPHQSIGKKTTKAPPAQDAAPAPVIEGAPQPAPDAQQTPEEVSPDAEVQRQEAEAAKKKAEAAEAEQQQKQENCATARANLANFQQGGRVYKMNEQGEREYLGDAELGKGLADAQAEVDKYCS
ncbi:MAG TPA: DUF4124 domain-containing protein [Methylophilaceae bacterium]|nr:DUF4124 domain-containing protein [Methylophilaceae bacterium]